ncbi:MAG: 30S ribosomal protein S2 [Parcubacteria group bacterium GW2011_GWA2_38_13]|nr:MAG: 30S ribosomal protein S2 [Parcubacteria group bacterium GW2011_GWA2_38_13]
MPQLPTVLELFKNGVHFGHQVSRWHPRMKPYLFTQKNGVHIINVETTIEKLSKSLEFVKKIVANGGTILFLGTKKQAQPILEKYALEIGMPYITERWLGGTFTNFSEISRVIKRYTTLKNGKESGDFQKYTKNEQMKFDKEMKKLHGLVKGIVNLKKLPEAVYIVDLKREKTAMNEALKKEIPIVALCDSNVNPEKITYPIPGNDDGIKSIELITKLIAEAIKEGTSDKNSKTKPK